MGKAARWLRNLLGGGGKKDKEQGKEQRRPSTPALAPNGDRKRWSFCKSSRDSSSEAEPSAPAPAGGNAAIARAAEAAWLKSLYKETEREQSKHAIAVAAATAAAADAAVAAAHAAVEVVRLTSQGPTSTAFSGVFAEPRGRAAAAVKIQTAFRGLLVSEEGPPSAEGAGEAAGAGARLPGAETGGGHATEHAGACPGAGHHPRRPLAHRRSAAAPRQPPQSRPAALLLARAVRHGRHAERAQQRGGVLQPPPVGQRGVVVVLRRQRPEPQDRGDGHRPAQVPLVLAPDEPTGGVRGRYRRGRLRLLRVVAAPAVPPPPPPRPARADRRAERAPLPGVRVVREGQAGDGAEHAPVHELRAGDAYEERVRRRLQQQSVDAELPQLHVEHAVFRGEGAFAERAEAAAGGGCCQRRSAEEGAAERGDHPAGGPGEPERRGHAEVVQPGGAGGGVQLQEGRGEPLRPLVGGGGRQGPGLVPAQGMVMLPGGGVRDQV